MTTPHPDTIKTWTGLTTISRVLLEDIEDALKSGGFPPLAWYDALLELEKVGTSGVRPYELRERLLLPQYGTSRLLDRLARAGLVEKADCPEDGRGQIVRITPAGTKLRKEMWPVYSGVLMIRLDSRLSRSDMSELAHLLGVLVSPPGK